MVGAVSKMIKPSADRRRKNDRNDAEFLARMLSVGNVVEVWVPDDECEAARDLTRALEDVSVNIIFTISTNAFSPIAPTRIHRIRQRGCAAFGA